MWRFFAFFFCAVSAEYSSNYFCGNLKHQKIVYTHQLMGMWYGVEVINHQDERHYVRNLPTCPILRVIESHPSTSTPHPLYRNRGYGDGFGYTSRSPRTNQQYNHQQGVDYYNKGYDSNLQDSGFYDLRKPENAFRYLTLTWEDESDTIEYNVRYNVSSPGIWYSSGPEKGVAINNLYRYHAGIIQVMKEVGNHMVLTFCHRMPENELFSVLLSRDPKMNNQEIRSVQSMLNNRNLNTNAVEKMCGNSSNRLIGGSYLGIHLVAIFIYGILK